MTHLMEHVSNIPNQQNHKTHHVCPLDEAEAKADRAKSALSTLVAF